MEAGREFHLEPRFDSESLPPVFRNSRRRLGAKWVRVDAGVVDTGDIVERLDGAERLP